MAWWDEQFPEYPELTWFYAASSYLNGNYAWWYKIPPDAYHYRQTAMKHNYTVTWLGMEPNQIYIICRPDDTPNWAGASLVAIAPACNNWGAYLYEVPESIQRDQTWGLNAAIQANQEKALGLKALVALTDELPSKITASIAGNPDEPAGISAYIKGDAEKILRIRAAIRKEQELPLGLVSAVAAPFDQPAGISAYVQGNPWEHCHLKAAIKGETETSVGIVAYVVKSRLDTILLEMENLWPQELDLRSTPNWRSRVKDWRTDVLGE